MKIFLVIDRRGYVETKEKVHEERGLERRRRATPRAPGDPSKLEKAGTQEHQEGVFLL